MMAIVLYTGFMEKNWSNLDLSNQDISSRNFTQTDFSNTNLSGANLANSDLSESIFFNVDLRGANLTGANLNNTVFVIQPQNIVGANFTGANLRGAFEYTGFVNLSNEEISGAICPDGTIQTNDNNCSTGFSTIPPPLLAPFFIPATVEFEVIPHETTIRYIGVHEFIPGVATNDMNNYLVINEQAYRELRGNQFVDSETSTTWIVDIDCLLYTSPSPRDS